MNERVSPQELSTLHRDTERIRNICILAHVDHGKTTLSDSLVCSNGVISSKLAGKLRYLDSTEEEQKRGITMHTSAISLLYRLEKSQGEAEDFLINLVDSPGHIDFSSDVSTATRLCDGAIIVIDILEGVCTQTHAVLYKALKERLKPCLVLNKVDRLCLELQLTPLEAFHHLRRILENVNALAFSLVESELRKSSQWTDRQNPDEEEDPMYGAWNFDPEKGNVVFSSALDCWGFVTAKFSSIWAKKLNLNRSVLQKHLFTDFALNTKTNKLVPCDTDNALKPMFVTMVLEPIWQLYDVAIVKSNPERAAKMAAKGLGVEIPNREVNVKDPRATIQSIFRRWLPLADAILRMVVRHVSSPRDAQGERLTALLPGFEPGMEKSFATEAKELLKEATPLTNSSLTVDQKVKQMNSFVAACDSRDSSEIVVFISKIISVRVGELSPRDLQDFVHRRTQLMRDNDEIGADQPTTNTVDPSEEVFLALGRVYSGVLKSSAPLFALGHRHDPHSFPQDADFHLPTDSIDPSTIYIPPGTISLYLCLGPSVFPVEELAAGNLVAIYGLGQLFLKTVTLASTWACLPMKAMTFQAKPMVCVAIEPLTHQDLPKVETGLRALYQYDPAVEISVDAMGQHMLNCLGELHLEQCLKILSERFAKCRIKSSEPIVFYRETVKQPLSGKHHQICSEEDGISSTSANLPPPWSDTPHLLNSRNGCFRLTLTSTVSVTFRCFSLPEAILTQLAAEKLEESPEGELKTPSIAFAEYLLKQSWAADRISQLIERCKISSDACELALSSFLGNLRSALQESLPEEGNQGFSIDRILSVGTSLLHNNLLMFGEAVPVGMLHEDWRAEEWVEKTSEFRKQIGKPNMQQCLLNQLWPRIHSTIVAAFQVVAGSGPLMQEPLHGVGFLIESVEFGGGILMNAIEELQKIGKEDIFEELVDLVQDLRAASLSDCAQVNVPLGQLLSESIDALKLAMLSCPLRIVEPIYSCDLQCDQTHLGQLYAVLSRRKGVVVSEDVIEGTTLFLLTAHIPVAESFGFASELLKKTSGNATAPQLMFSHWQVSELDPFWKPTTALEREDFGEITHEANPARECIDKVRRRKGLPVEEKIVAFAEKQRTLNKKK